MSDKIREFIDNPAILPKNYSTYLEGVKTRAEVIYIIRIPTAHKPNYQISNKERYYYLFSVFWGIYVY